MSFVSQCFFEYGQRWPELRPYVERITNSGDGSQREALDILVEAMETRDRDIEDHLNHRPCGGGASVYCGRTNGALDSGLSAQLETSVSFDLGATSTVGITISFTADAEDWATLMAFDWTIDAAAVSFPTLYRSNPTLATATTLAAGSHTIAASVTGGNMNTTNAQCTIMVVVGSDTEDDCVILAE